jgi:hypothetical protein
MCLAQRKAKAWDVELTDGHQHDWSWLVQIASRARYDTRRKPQLWDADNSIQKLEGCKTHSLTPLLLFLFCFFGFFVGECILLITLCYYDLPNVH